MLAKEMHTKYWNGVRNSAVSSWKNGIIKYPTKIATPLNGSNYVPIFNPKYYTKPGPARVVIDLLISPIKTIIIIIIGLLRAKLQ